MFGHSDHIRFHRDQLLIIRVRVNNFYRFLVNAEHFLEILVGGAAALYRGSGDADKECALGKLRLHENEISRFPFYCPGN